MTARRRAVQPQAVPTIPAFPNAFPYNELLFTGRLDIDGHAVKSRSWNWKHRGPVVLYTSTRVDKPVARAYDLDPKDATRGMIVGAADLVDVRQLTKAEMKALVCGFNNTTWEKVRRSVSFYEICGSLQCLLDRDDEPLVLPFHLGFFFERVTRFERPVSFAWPQGAVRSTNVPLSVVEDALRQAGF